MSSRPDLGEPTCKLKAKTHVLLIEIEKDTGAGQELALRGRVIPPAPADPGWLPLEAPQPGVPAPKNACVTRRRLPGSWEIRGRYEVKYPATLRASPSLVSDMVAEVGPGQEVLVLQLDINAADMGSRARLRAMVNSCETGVVGWLSPETADGDLLLDPANLLSIEGLRKSMSRSASDGSGGRGTQRGSVMSPSSGGKVNRKSFHGGGPSPWQVGSRYRVVERIGLRQSADLSGELVGSIEAGMLVTVAEMFNVETTSAIGWCPFAYVTVDEGNLAGHNGWLPCVASDGHDLLDTRDHLEFEKVVQQLSFQHDQRSTGGPESGEPVAQAEVEAVAEDEDDEATEEESEEEEGEEEEEEEKKRDGKQKPEAQAPDESLKITEPMLPVSAQLSGLEDMSFPDKLQQMEIGAKEEKLVEDPTIIQPPPSMCDRICICGVSGRRPVDAA